jgi:hypothetical protein
MCFLHTHQTLQPQIDLISNPASNYQYMASQFTIIYNEHVTVTLYIILLVPSKWPQTQMKTNFLLNLHTAPPYGAPNDDEDKLGVFHR